MVETRPFRHSVVLIFALLGAPLSMAFGLAEVLFKGLLTPGDLSVAIILVVIGTHPLGLLEPLAILTLPFTLTGLMASRLDRRVRGPDFVVICTAVGAALTLLSAPLLGASPSMPMATEGGLAALVCALAAQLRWPSRQGGQARA